LLPALNPVAAWLVRFNFGRSAPCPVFEGSELARQKQELMFELVKQALAVPRTLDDGRVYTPAKLINFKKAFESLNVPIDDPEDVAEEQAAPAPPVTPREEEPMLDATSPAGTEVPDSFA
jgi:hypothetical protein